jgi:Tfp pilus assembly protein PilF
VNISGSIEKKDNWAEDSLSYYQRALEKDPNFALAYIGMADYYIRQSGQHISGREVGGQSHIQHNEGAGA